ncbi:uncharacterized protein LOC116164914 [Photinus pyralis]|uniref:uncharacterized protein LOC116164914 n=1 Tax=Photinus pyralis TaxID=7054 RepID=UPI0012678045|nr:uncharacterized protein LOC116164914 [Photinus pyralis]
MPFIGVQFEEGETIAIVNKSWLTPRKQEVFWPPYRTQEQYYRSLKNHEAPSETTWKLYKVSRIFFEEDDYEKALQKIKLTEVTSDVQTDNETAKRKRKAPRRLLTSSEHSSESGSEEDKLPRRFPRLKSSNLESQSSFIQSSSPWTTNGNTMDVLLWTFIGSLEMDILWMYFEWP